MLSDLATTNSLLEQIRDELHTANLLAYLKAHEEYRYKSDEHQPQAFKEVQAILGQDS